MPAEISSVDEFLKLAERASVCYVKRAGDKVKLKLRTPKMLYTIKVSPTQAGRLKKKIKCEIVEID